MKVMCIVYEGDVQCMKGVCTVFVGGVVQCV